VNYLTGSYPDYNSNPNKLTSAYLYANTDAIDSAYQPIFS